MKGAALIAPAVAGLLLTAFVPASADTAQSCADQWKIMAAADKAKASYETFWTRCTGSPSPNVAIFPDKQSPPVPQCA